MAEGAVQFLLENLRSLIQGEIGLIFGVNTELKKLPSTLTAIQAVLEDAEEKQLLGNRAIHNWLCKLNGLIPEIEDILDEFATEVSKLNYLKNKSIRYLKNLFYRRKIGRRIKDVTDELNSIAAERANLHLHEIIRDTQINIAPNRDTCSVIDESHPVYGREKDKEIIVDILLNQSKDRRELSILPIIGVGGLGKTTLAQLVFNDSRVAEHFDIKLWVCVSNDFDSKTLIKAILESASGNGNASGLMHLDTLQRQLSQLLRCKRYLLVLDDVWKEDPDKWSLMKSILACGSSGASILVTTRLQIVVDIMSTFPAHHLTGLSKEDCWSLMKQRAFGQEEEHHNLEAIGKQIAMKCGGVPLAAKALGGLLRYKRTERKWIHVKESEIWNLPQTENSILPALRLSYNHLPMRLRQCFVYCAVFPKDYEIEKEELIHRWISHGYISSTGTLEAEDLGHEMWNELVLRCLFQNVKERRDIKDEDQIIIFSLHDLIHDLAQSIMENKGFGTEHVKINDRSASNTKIREVNLTNNTVAFPTRIQLNMDLIYVFTKFSRLRMLNASRRSIKDVPSLVGKLTHLRYLNFSYTTIRSLPNAICSLWNLKTLNLNHCKELLSLPKNMRYMHNLRHLFLDGCDSLSEIPPKISELTSLKTLGLFVVDHKKSNELKDLRLLDLGGRLYIDHLERVKSHEEATEANLVEKQKLKHLGLVWRGDDELNSEGNVDEKVLEALQTHQNLVSLAIDGYRGNDFPHWMSNSTLVNIVEIKIIRCPNCLHLPKVLGEFPHLKKLILRELKLQYIIDDECRDISSLEPKFQRLQHLELAFLPNLRGLLKDDVEEMFPNIQQLHVQGCPSLILPNLLSLKKLRLYDCSNATVTSLFASFDAITSLWLRFGENLTCISKHTLEKFTNLKTLILLRSHEHCFPEGGLDCLKSLEHFILIESPTLTYFPRVWISQLTTVKVLGIRDCPEFIEFPEEIKNLISLQTLIFVKLPRLTLPLNWLGNFTSLVLLGIVDCQNLTSIPDIIKEMQNLQSLYIWNCPKLERQCEKGEGEDWHKVAHIADLSFDVTRFDNFNF